MISKTGNFWPIVPAPKPNRIALQKDSAVRFSPKHHNDLIRHETRVLLKTSYFREKGSFIDIYV